MLRDQREMIQSGVPAGEYRIYQTDFNKTLPDCTPADISQFIPRLLALREDQDPDLIEQLWLNMGQAMPGAIDGQDGVSARQSSKLVISYAPVCLKSYILMT